MSAVHLGLGCNWTSPELITLVKLKLNFNQLKVFKTVSTAGKKLIIYWFSEEPNQKACEITLRSEFNNLDRIINWTE